MKRKNILSIFLLTGLLTLCLTLDPFRNLFLTGRALGGVNNKAVEEEYGEALRLFNQSLSLIHDNYVDPEKVKVEDLIYGAIEGMIKKLDDPHTRFMDPEAYKEMEIEARGSFEGLGIVIGLKEDQLTVISPLDDTPAYRVGIEAGDKIVEIEGKSTKDITLQEAVKKLRGPKGTKVTITIEREGEPESLHFTITRDTIKPRAVTFKALDKIGYIRIPSFNQWTNKELKNALKELSKKEVEGLILDLRNNPGGLLGEAVEVSDRFVSQGLIVSTKGRVEGQTKEYKAHAKGTYNLCPLVVLINEGSASGSEIVAGAIKDNKQGILIGTKTFGKGSVQSVVELPGDCGISLTTAKYYTPSGLSIHELGINPDIEVKYPLFSLEERKIFAEEGLFEEFVKEYAGEEEFTLDKKVLRDFEKLLKKKGLDFKPELLKKNRDLLEERIRLEIIRESKGEKEARLFVLKQDPQVKRALEVLRAAKILRD